MALFAQIPTLVYTAVLGLDSASTAGLARLAFGALLWIVLVILNRDAASASTRPSALEVGAVPSPRRRLEPRSRCETVAWRPASTAPATPRAGFGD
ncbi:MAG: hypothetical protein E6J77_28265 [Deltaproteobacteria bacterium]|nr:MAG: hypothetical protein E6J77_28265 [Deltaproteobacteria bacterium]